MSELGTSYEGLKQIREEGLIRWEFMTFDSDDLFEAAKYIAIARGYLQNPDAASKIGSHASHTKNVKDRYLLMRNNFS